MKKIICYVLLASICIQLCACGKRKEPVDPHAGQVYLYDGYDWVWYTPLEGVPLNGFTKDDFQYVSGTPQYTGNSYSVKRGFDISEHQLKIDWDTVNAFTDYDFCYIRAGRRGYTQGGIFEDEYFDRNYAGAVKCGLEIGVYFFSQAISVGEAIEEAEWLLNRIKGYNITLPITFDWEKVDADDARTAGLDVNTLTDCAVAFCETIRRAGYTPCVYFNRTTGYYRYDLSRLKDFPIWFALPCTPPDVTYPSFYYHFDMWQYSLTGYIPGISVETDLDYIFKEVPASSENIMSS